MGGRQGCRMKNGKLFQLSLKSRLIFLFLCNIQEDPLPIQRVALRVANQVAVLFHPNDSSIAPDHAIFFEKTRAVKSAAPIALEDSLSIVGMDGLYPDLWVGAPFACCITCEFLNPRADIQRGLFRVGFIQEYNG